MEFFSLLFNFTVRKPQKQLTPTLKKQLKFLQRIFGINSSLPRAYGLQASLLLMAMMLFGVPKAMAESIDANHITINNYLNTEGYIEVVIPVFENDNYDECLKTNDNTSDDNEKTYISINNVRVLYLNASPQSDPGDNSAWCDAKAVNGDYTICTYSYSGGSNKLVKLENRWIKSYYRRSENYYNASFLIFPAGYILADTTEFTVDVHAAIDVNNASDEVVTKSTITPLKYNTPSVIKLYSNYSADHPGKNQVYFNGTKDDKYKIDNGEEITLKADGSHNVYFDVQNEPRKVPFTYYKRLSAFSYYPLNDTITLRGYQHPNDFTATMNSSGNVDLT